MFHSGTALQYSWSGSGGCSGRYPGQCAHTIQVYWIMKLHPYRWDMCKPLLAGGVATLVGMLLLHFVHFQPGLGDFAILEQIGLIIPFILVYVLVMWLLRFSEEDRIVFNAVLTRFGRQRSTDLPQTSQ